MKVGQHLSRDQSRCITFRVIMGREKAAVVAAEYGVKEKSVTLAIRRTLKEVASVEFALIPDKVKRGPSAVWYYRRDPLLRARLIETL